MDSTKETKGDLSRWASYVREVLRINEQLEKERNKQLENLEKMSSHGSFETEGKLECNIRCIVWLHNPDPQLYSTPERHRTCGLAQ